MTKIKRYGLVWGERIFFGFERSTIFVGDEKYMDRWVLYCFGTLRLHKMYRGDDERAVHDHPWSFITFPLSSYTEMMQCGGKYFLMRVVKHRFHFRPATYRHFITDAPADRDWPKWTIVATGPRVRKWGFWPKPDVFVPYNEWESYNG